MHVAATAAQSIELGEAGIVADDCLAIDQAGGDLEAVQRLPDERKALRPVVAVAGQEGHAAGSPPRQKPESIVFYLVNPVSARRRLGNLGRQAWLDKVGERTHTPQHALLHAARGGRSRIEFR